MALNYRMTRAWGFTPAGFASYTVVTNLWDVLAKLFLPILVVPLLVLGLPVGVGLGHLMTAAVIALPVVAAGRDPHRAPTRRGPARGARGAGARAGGDHRDRRLGTDDPGHGPLHRAPVRAPRREPRGDRRRGLARVVLLAFCAERLATLVGLTPGGSGSWRWGWPGR